MVYRKVLMSGASEVVDVALGVVTAQVLVQEVDERYQLQRWFLRGQPHGYNAPPSVEVLIQQPPSTAWDLGLTDWLTRVQAEWSSGSRFVKALFCSHSHEEQPDLPADPVSSPGFPSPPMAGCADGKPAQYDVGTLYAVQGQHQSWVFRMPSESSGLYYEYFVLNAGHDASAMSSLQVHGAPPESAFATLAEFVSGMASLRVWGEQADTFVLATCCEVTNVELIS